MLTGYRMGASTTHLESAVGYARQVSSKASSCASVALPDSSRKMTLSLRLELKGGSR